MATIACPNPSNPSGLLPVLPDAAQAITPSDSDTFAEPVHVFVGVGGNVRCVPWNGNSALTVAVATGGFVPFRVRAVYSTSTTAAGLIAVY